MDRNKAKYRENAKIEIVIMAHQQRWNRQITGFGPHIREISPERISIVYNGIEIYQGPFRYIQWVQYQEVNWKGASSKQNIQRWNL